MATNAIQGDLIGLFISEVLVTPLTTDWKEVVCGENAGLDGSRDVTSKKTKCGVIKGYGPTSWVITGSGTHNTAPGTTQISANKLISLFQGETEILVKLVYATDSSLYYRQGEGQITKYTEGANVGDPLSFDFTIEVTGIIDFTA